MVTRQNPQVRATVRTLKALASRSRLRILRCLLDRRRTVSEIARVLNLSKGSVHSHLEKLQRAGFVARDEDPDRTWVYYELTDTGEQVIADGTVRLVVALPASIAVLIVGTGLIAYAVLRRFLQGPLPLPPGTPAPTGGPVTGIDPVILLLAGGLLVGLGAAATRWSYAVLSGLAPRAGSGPTRGD